MLVTSRGIECVELPLYGGGARAWVCCDASEMRWSWFCLFLWSLYQEFPESAKQPLENVSIITPVSTDPYKLLS